MNFNFKNKGFVYAIMAAVLFGISTPFTKLLLPNCNPWLMAGLLYFGSGFGLLCLTIISSICGKKISSDKNLSLKDYPWICGAIALGGILGPIFLMHGLTSADASSASLLLNTEGVFTAGFAWFLFKENFDRRIAFGMLLIICGGLVLSWQGFETSTFSHGYLFIIIACICWALDNNLTNKIASSNPFQLVIVKSLIAGTTNIILSMLLGATIPEVKLIFQIGLLGFIAYGLSLYCFVLALRYLGTARTGAFFSLAPFVGAIFSILILKESYSYPLILASVLMGMGVWLHLTEKHEHLHKHGNIVHSHPHFPDAEHRHEHNS